VIYRLTEAVFVQENSAETKLEPAAWTQSDRLSRVPRLRIDHVVNFYRATGSARRSQELTAESIRRAAAAVRDVRLLAVVSTKEADAVPVSFRGVARLERTITDIKQFTSPRPLPLLFDILACGAAAARSNSYLVFTNSDICLQRSFYSSARSLLARGFDCLLINRRTVEPFEAYGNAPELAALEVGNSHPGLDCFVFPAEWVRDFHISHACVGVGYVMRSLLFNLVVKARRMLILRDAHLTYHYGDDRPWNMPDSMEYMEHNVKEARAVLSALSTDSTRRATLVEFCTAHGEGFPDGPCFRPSVMSADLTDV
jgi:hypothetical protein